MSLSTSTTVLHPMPGLSRGELAAVLELVSFCHNDGKRPDGVFLIPWWLPFTWDLTSSDHGLGNV